MNDDRSAELRDVTLAVLAGGAGVRMGVPKALLTIGDKPILTWLLARYRWPGPTMLVTAPDTPAPPGAGGFDSHVVDRANGVGPLEGVRTALVHAATDLVAIVTVDMPNLDATKLASVVGTLRHRPARLGLMCRRADAGVIEPFPCVLRREAIVHVDRALATGRGAVHSICDDVAIVAEKSPADWPSDAWLNLNEPGQFAAFVQTLQIRIERTR